MAADFAEIALLQNDPSETGFNSFVEHHVGKSGLGIGDFKKVGKLAAGLGDGDCLPGKGLGGSA